MSSDTTDANVSVSERVMLLISMLVGMVYDSAAGLTAALRHAQSRTHEIAQIESFRRDQVAAGESVTQLVTVGATLFIGIVVLASIGDAMPSNVSMFQGAMDQAETILNSSFVLAAILPLVIIAAALLFYVRRFNSNGGGGNGR